MSEAYISKVKWSSGNFSLLKCPCYTPGMTAFGELVSQRMRALALSRSEMGRRLKTSQGFVTLVIQGKRTPPLERLDDWADLLEVAGIDRDKFIELGWIAHLPVEVQAYFVKKIERLYQLESDYLELLSQVRRVASPKES